MTCPNLIFTQRGYTYVYMGKGGKVWVFLRVDQENGTLPVGPKMTSREWYAGSRLG